MSLQFQVLYFPVSFTDSYLQLSLRNRDKVVCTLANDLSVLKITILA